MGSGGSGGPVHMTGELFNMMAGLKMQHVPYRGEAPALNDLIGGQVQVVFGSVPASIEYVRAGKLRALAVTTSTRSELLPDVPTVAESVPGYESSTWYGIGAPKDTPAEIIDRLNVEINAALRRSDVEDESGRPRRHGDRRFSDGLQRAHRVGHRKMGQGGEVRGHQAGMTRAHADHIVITWKAPAAAREGGRSPTPSGVRGCTAPNDQPRATD